jgi:glyoxylase-like metal-dependent hydrolase (beta-lactamase superfamily II)
VDHDLTMHTLRIGAAQVSVVTTGVGRWTMAQHLRKPPEGWQQGDLATIEQPCALPFQCIHIALGAASVVVDTMDLAAYREAHGWFPQPWHRFAPRLDRQLARQGIAAADITHVVLTHAHDDHYIVATIEDEESGQRRPLFPEALYIAERADWTPEGQQTILEALDEDERLPDATERFMGELFRRGRVRLVEGNYDVAPGIRLVPAPGETPGHALVRVHSDGETLYCLGDLFHHPIEIEHPDWVPLWADPEATIASRRSLIAAALAEGALLVASHIQGIGQIRTGASGINWEPVG